jgi:serine protease
MKRFLVPVLWVAAGTSILALTSTSPAAAGIYPGTGTHRAQAHVIDSHRAGSVHVINLHKAYEARLGTAALGKIAGKVPPFGAPPIRGRGGNNCAEPTCPLQYNGGVVQHTPHVYLLLWGPNWSTDPSQEATATYLENFYSGLGHQPQDNWSTVTKEYPDGSGPPTFSNGVYAGTWNDMSSPPTNGMLGQVGLATEADTFTAAMGVTDLNDAQVVIATQSGTCPDGFAAPMCNPGSGRYCAWHSSSNEPYTNLPYILDAGTTCGQDSVNSNGTDDGFSIVAGHEYAATITDPFPGSGWWDPADPNGGEITDKCVWNGHSRDVTLATGIFAMQPEWSNSAGGCVMHIGGSSDIVTLTNPKNQTTYQNSALSLTVEATSSGQNPVTWSSTGLPAGLTIDPATGIITGRLTAPASGSPYSVIVSASDTTGAFAWAPFTWTVLADVGSPITNQASGTCLNDRGWSTTPGNPVFMWKCLKGPAEMFSQPTNSGELIVLGQCMSDPTGPHKGGAGALQEIDPCTGATNQMWFHNAQNEYVLESNFLCLTNQGGVTENGAPVSIEPCTGATDQIWSGS